MLTDRSVFKQISRLRSLPRGEGREWGTREEPALGAELVRVMKRVAHNDRHAEAIIDRVIDTAQFCPTPMELREIAEQTGDPTKRSADPFCSLCGGKGYVLTQTCGENYFPKDRTLQRMYAGVVVDSCEPCSCRRAG